MQKTLNKEKNLGIDMEKSPINRPPSGKISVGLIVLGLLLFLLCFFLYTSIFYIILGIIFILFGITARKSKGYTASALIFLCLSIPILSVYSLIKVNLGRFTLEQFLFVFVAAAFIFLLFYTLSFIRLIRNMKYFKGKVR